ncbi:MAG: hypothetical protein ACYC2H_03905 [Thermoplasmatota archaeon]
MKIRDFENEFPKWLHSDGYAFSRLETGDANHPVIFQVKYRPNPTDMTQPELDVFVTVNRNRRRVDFVLPIALAPTHKTLLNEQPTSAERVIDKLFEGLFPIGIGLGWVLEGKKIGGVQLDTFAYEDAPLTRHLVLRRCWDLYTGFRAVSRALANESRVTEKEMAISLTTRANVKSSWPISSSSTS